MLLFDDIFSQVTGLVTETGGMLFHGSIVAREYSIPDEPGLDTDAEMTKHGQEITVESDLDRDTLQ